MIGCRRPRRALVSSLTGLTLLALCGSCGPPPAPEELPPRFVFRIEFRDPCNEPLPGVQYDLYADPVQRRPERPADQPPLEWRSHLRGQADEFGEARVELGTDWGTLVDVHAAFAGQISEVRAAPDCYLEITNRQILEVVLDSFTCAESRARAKRGDAPFVRLYSRSLGNNYKRRKRSKVRCEDTPPSPSDAPPAGVRG